MSNDTEQAGQTGESIERIVVVGAGLAGAAAVEQLRKDGYAGALTVVGEEPDPPYERPQLSKDFLKGDKEFALRHEADWYAEHDVTLVTDVGALGIDLAEGTLSTTRGEPLPFDRLLLATGAAPRRLSIPGAESARTLRTIADARAIKEHLRPGQRVVLVGGGWIGLEIAAAAREQGAEATVLEAADLPLVGVLGPELARHLTALHEKHGVEIRTGVTVEAIEQDGVVTADGKVDADLVVMAVGAAPLTALAEAAGLDVDGGILVDEHLRTSDPRVYAAGDVATAHNTLFGRLRVEHWDNAIRQGRLAARTMRGQHATYDWAPYFYTDQFEFSMEYVGHASPDDEVVIRGDLEGNEFIAYWLDGGVMTAGMNVGIWDVNDQLRGMIGKVHDRHTLGDLR